MVSVTTRDVPVYGTDTDIVESTAHPRVSWGAVFAGAVVALGVWAMLYALGLAVGLSTLNPNDPSTMRSSGIFTGIWGLIAPLIALFVGGLVAARSSGVVRRLDGAIHGLVMWGLATVAGGWLVAMLMATVVGGAASLGRTAIESQVAPERAAAAAERAKRTPMGRAAEELRRGVTGTPGPTAQRDALEAAEDSGKAFGGMFGALFLGMVSAVAGGLVGMRSRHRREARMVTTAPPTTTTTAPPLSTQREAYP